MHTALDLLRDAGNEPAIAEQAQGILARQLAELTRLADDLLELSRAAKALQAPLGAPNDRRRAR